MTERELLWVRAVNDCVITIAYVSAIPLFAWLLWKLVLAVQNRFLNDNRPPKDRQ